MMKTFLVWARQFAPLSTRHCAAAGGTKAGNLARLVNGGLSLCLLALLLGTAQAQVTSIRPDCFQFFTFTVPANSLVFDNRSAGCPYFAIAYSSNGFTVESLVVQVAPDAGGTPGTWATYTAATGINPNTAITQAFSTFTGYFPWVRVQLTSKTGTGSIQGVLYGWKTNAQVIAATGTTACPGTVAVPCVVVGPIAQGGDVSTTHPVVIQGIDYLNNHGVVPEVDTSTGGLLHQNVPNSLGDAIPNNQPVFSTFGVPLFMQVMPTVFTGGNGAGVWDRQFACTNQQNVTLTTIGLTRIITSNGIANKVRICSLSLAFASPVDVRLVEGTRVTTDCDTGATNMTGLLRSIVAWDPPWSPLSALREQVAGNDVCVSMSASVNGGGTVIYATF